MKLDVLDPADRRPEVGAALRAWLALQSVLGLRPATALRALAEARDPLAALRLAGKQPPRPAVLEASAARLRQLRAVAVPFGSPAYPAGLARLADAAPLLLVRGQRSALHAPCVAIVGSRAATVYGRALAREFAGALAAAGATVVSGLAVGIDAVAHQAALEAGGRTLAVLACGPDRVYPVRHRQLAERIVERGALLSEFAPGTEPRRAFFPLRNRLISGLSQAVLVVEARLRSGSLTTAAHAAEQGVDVFAVPGPLSAPTSAGTNRLLYDGAHVALSPELLLDELRRWGGLPDAPQPQRRPCRAPRRLCSEQQRILTALEDEPLARDELGRRLALSPEQLARDLVELELEGRVAEDRDGRLRVVGSA